MEMWFINILGSIEKVYNATLLTEHLAKSGTSLLSMRSLMSVEMGMSKLLCKDANFKC